MKTFLSAVALLLSSSAAAAELTTVSLETSPGLTDQAVGEVLEKARPELEKCIRVVASARGPGQHIEIVPFEPKPGDDDRVLVVFEIDPEGKVTAPNRERMVRATAAEEECVEDALNGLRFSADRSRLEVKVRWTFRLRVSPDERKEQLKRRHDVLTAFCDAFHTGKPKNAQDFAGIVAAFARGRSWPSRELKNIFNSLEGVYPEEKPLILQAGAKELAYPNFCPELESWRKKLKLPSMNVNEE